MSTIPTVAVSVILHEQDGSPIQGAEIEAKLETLEKFNGFIVPDMVEGVTDATGTTVLNLFPNELGSEASEYRFTLSYPSGRTDTIYAVVPNADCELQSIAELDPYECRSVGDVISGQVIYEIRTEAGTQLDQITTEGSNQRSSVETEGNKQRNQIVTSTNTIRSEITTERNNVIYDIEAKRSSALSDVQTSGTSATTAIETLRSKAMHDVGNTFNQSIATITEEANTAYTEIQSRSESAIAATESARDTAVASKNEATRQADIATTKTQEVTQVKADVIAAQQAVDTDKRATETVKTQTEQVYDATVLVKNAADDAAALAVNSKNEAAEQVTIATTRAEECAQVKVDAIAAKAQAEAARDSAVEAVAGVDTARANAINEITAKRTAAVDEINTEQVEAATQIEAAKQAVMQKVKDMPEYLPNYEVTLQEQISKAISGQIAGTSGKWKHVDSYEQTVSITRFTHVNWGSTATALQGMNTALAYFGSQDKIIESFFGIIIGDSGSPYIVVYTVASGHSEGTYLLPQHGDTQSDFTIGNSYNVRVFQESTVPEDQQTGTRDVVEYFVGNELVKTLDNVLPVGSYGTLNAGYWEGTAWQSQLLGDAEYLNPGEVQYLRLKLKNKWTVGSEIEVLNASGVWVSTTGDFTQQSGARFISSLNVIDVNVGQSFTYYGYSSTVDMCANGAIRAKYKTHARIWRPIANPNNVKIVGDVHLLQHNAETLGSRLFQDLTGQVTTAQGGYPRVDTSIRYQWAPKSAILPSWFQYSKPYEVNDAKNPLRCIFACGLAEIGGALHLVAWFKEMVFDRSAGDKLWWGDDCYIPIVDYVQTIKDTNGNDVLCGTMGIDIGIPV